MVALKFWHAVLPYHDIFDAGLIILIFSVAIKEVWEQVGQPGATLILPFCIITYRYTIFVCSLRNCTNALLQLLYAESS